MGKTTVSIDDDLKDALNQLKHLWFLESHNAVIRRLVDKEKKAIAAGLKEKR